MINTSILFYFYSKPSALKRDNSRQLALNNCDLPNKQHQRTLSRRKDRVQ